MAKIRVAYHAITWGRDGLLQCLGDISDLGYRAFEPFTHVADEYAHRLSEFKELCARYGVRLSALYGGGQFIYPELHQEEIERNLRWAKFLYENGACILDLGPGTRRPDGTNAPEDYVNQAKVLNELGKRALEEYGVYCTLHPHWGTSVETREEIERIADLTDPRYVFFCMDPAHLTRGGSDPVEVFNTYYDRIRHVHWKDIPMTPDQFHTLPREVIQGDAQVGGFVELGEGRVDLVTLADILRRNGYDGWTCIELDTTTRTPKESAAISKRYATEVMGLSLELDE